MHACSLVHSHVCGGNGCRYFCVCVFFLVDCLYFCTTECTSTTTWYNLFICFWWHKSGTVLCQNSSRLASSIARHDLQVHMTTYVSDMLCVQYLFHPIIRMSICLCADTASAHLLSPHHLPLLHRTVDLHFFISLTGIYMTQNYIDATTKINIKLLCAPMFFMPFQIHMYTLVPQIVNNK